MKPNARLKKFLLPYDSHIQKLTLALRSFVVHLVPEANELIWDNYNAVAMAYSKSEKLKDAFCHIAVYSKHVNFGFNRGAELTVNELQLLGKGKLIRHIAVHKMEFFPKEKVEKLMWQAVGIAEHLNPALTNKKSLGKSIVMSVSEKKIRP